MRLPFRKERQLCRSLFDILGFYPHDMEHYTRALMHKSMAAREGTGRPYNNERLEFLGDAILDAVVGDIVYKAFRGKREGFLTSTRSKVVKRETLGQLAEKMGLIQLIQCNMSSHNHNSYMGGNAFEALVGAVYLDRGYDYCMYFMQEKVLGRHINLTKLAYSEANFKSKLLEWAQKNHHEVTYQLLEEGKDDESSSPVFFSSVLVDGNVWGKGKGYSKKESQQLASREALKRTGIVKPTRKGKGGEKSDSK